MESLQQATDGDGQRRNAKRYQESNITLRRYIEDEHVQETEPNGWWEALLVIKARSFTAPCAAKPETNKGQKISNALRKKTKNTFCQRTFLQQRANATQCQFRQSSKTTWSVKGTDTYSLLRCMSQLTQSFLFRVFLLIQNVFARWLHGFRSFKWFKRNYNKVEFEV